MKVQIARSAGSMDILEYADICEEYYEWLNDRHISYSLDANDWHTLPTAVEFENDEDAIMFKLTFGL